MQSTDFILQNQSIQEEFSQMMDKYFNQKKEYQEANQKDLKQFDDIQQTLNFDTYINNRDIYPQILQILNKRILESQDRKDEQVNDELIQNYLQGPILNLLSDYKKNLQQLDEVYKKLTETHDKENIINRFQILTFHKKGQGLVRILFDPTDKNFVSIPEYFDIKAKTFVDFNQTFVFVLNDSNLDIKKKGLQLFINFVNSFLLNFDKLKNLQPQIIDKDKLQDMVQILPLMTSNPILKLALQLFDKGILQEDEFYKCF